MADTPSYDLPTVPPDDGGHPTAPTGSAEFADADKYLGRTVGGVKLDRLLGAGGMGAVFAGEHERLGKQVAIKILPKGLARERERAERFLREARAAAKLEHPNIVTVYDVGEDDDVWFISMRFVGGESAAGRVRRAGPLPVREVLRVTRAIAAALDAAHRRSIVHRDVKPENVLLGEDDEVLLADFGLVRDLESNTQLSQSGQILGTPAYMSPEQARGEPVDHRSDIYSLGTTAYYLATGLPPFQAETAIATALKHIMDDAVPPSEEQPGIPRAFDVFVEQLMAKQPDHRPASAAAVMDEIDRLLDGGLHAAPAAAGPKLGTGILAGAAVAVVLLLVIGGGLALRGRGKKPRTRGGTQAAADAPKERPPTTTARPPAPVEQFADPAATERALQDLYDDGSYDAAVELAAKIMAAPEAPDALLSAAERVHIASKQKLEEGPLRDALYSRIASFRRLVRQGGSGDEFAAFVPPGAPELEGELVRALLRLTPEGVEWGGDPEIGPLGADPKGNRSADVILPLRRRAAPTAGATGWHVQFLHVKGEWYPRFPRREETIKPALTLLLDRVFGAAPRDRKRILEGEIDASLQARGLKPGTPDYRRTNLVMVRGLGFLLGLIDRAEQFEYQITGVQFDTATRVATADVRLVTTLPAQPQKDSTSPWTFTLVHGRWVFTDTGEAERRALGRGDDGTGRKPGWGKGRKKDQRDKKR